MSILGSKKLSMMVLIAGIVSIGMGSFFIYQGFNKASFITETMKSEKITYSGADGTIVGYIDTPAEAQAMIDVLKEHRMAQGVYTELKRDDPARQSILNAIGYGKLPYTSSNGFRFDTGSSGNRSLHDIDRSGSGNRWIYRYPSKISTF